MRHIPYSIVALAPFRGADRDVDTPRFIGPLDLYDVDDGIAALGCGITVPLPKTICPEGEIRIGISKLADVKPQNLVRRSAYLSRLVDALDFVKTNRTDPEALAVGLQRHFGDLPLDLSVLLPKPAPEASDSLLDAILSKVDIPGDAASPSPSDLDRQIESMLKTALTHVYNDNDFRQLESVLRGLQTLVRQGGVKKSTRVTVTLLNVDFDNLEPALRHIVRSSAERPPSLVLVDLPFDNTFAGVDALETLANFSEAIEAPTVAHLAPAFFGKQTFADFDSVGYLAHELDTQPYAKFRALKSRPAAKWLTLALPRMCVRNRYGNGEAARPVPFEESDDVFISPVWAVGALTVKSQNAFGWPCRLTDQSVCQLEQAAIPRHRGKRTPLDAMFKEDRLNQFYEIGMAPLRAWPEREQIFMTKAPTMNGGTLGFQLFASRVIGFFYHQKAVLAGNPEIREPAELIARLRAQLEEKWGDTEPPLPDDLVIGVAHTDPAGHVVLSIRLTPPRSLVPAAQLLEFEVSFPI